MSPLLTAHTGSNAPLFAEIMRHYVPRGARVLDATYGLGNFWRDVEPGAYQLITLDTARPAVIRGDLRHVPLADGTVDAVILDPPYAGNGSKHKRAIGIDSTYNLPGGLSHVAISGLYVAGMREAARVLRGGWLIVKCQDQIEGGRQRWQHRIVMETAEALGFEVADLFVLVSNGVPLMRHPHQLHARKNHSYFVVCRKTQQQGAFL